MRRKSKKISEIKSATSDQDDIMGVTLPTKAESPGIGTDSPHLEFNEIQDLLATEGGQTLNGWEFLTRC